MSAQHSRHNRCKPVHHFPSDLRYANVTPKATASEISCLGRDVLLSTAVVDFIIQSAALPPDISEERVPPMIGSLGSVAFISSANLTASYKQDQVSTIETWHANQDIISNLCITLCTFAQPHVCGMFQGTLQHCHCSFTCNRPLVRVCWKGILAAWFGVSWSTHSLPWLQ